MLCIFSNALRQFIFSLLCILTDAKSPANEGVLLKKLKELSFLCVSIFEIVIKSKLVTNRILQENILLEAEVERLRRDLATLQNAFKTSGFARARAESETWLQRELNAKLDHVNKLIAEQVSFTHYF